MSTISKNISAVDTVLERLRGMRFQITPEEHQLLGITPEDVASFSDPGLELTPVQMEQAIQEIVTTAYHETPAFRKLVTEDQRRDPRRFTESARLVSKFLKHLRGALPPERAAWIHPDTFPQAHGMVETALRTVVPGQAPVEQRQFPAAEPLSDADLQLFGLKRSQLTPEIQRSSLKRPILFFLGRLKNEQGRTVKNEATAKMPDALRQTYLFRLLREIRDLKLAKNKSLHPFEQRWLGRDLAQLEQLAAAIVKRPAAREPIQRGDDIVEIMSGTQGALTVTERLLAALKKRDLRESLTQLGDVIDTALPPVSLVEDRIQAIQAAVNDLGLSREQLSMLLEIDPETLRHTPEISKERVDETRRELVTLNKSIAEKDKSEGLLVPRRSVERRLKNVEDLLAQRRNVERRLKNIEDLSALDTSALFAAISEYTDTLSAYRATIDRSLSKTTQDAIPNLKELLDYTGELSRQFGRLIAQDIFKRKWQGHTGRLFRPGEAPAEGESEISKTAAPDIAGYSKKLEAFRGGGVRKILDELVDFADDTEEGLEFLRDKFLSIMEVGPDSPLHTSPGHTDFRGNPLGGQGPGLDEMKKKLDRIRTLVKRLDLSRKKQEALDVMQYLTDLPSHVSAGKKQQKKQASVADCLRRIASFMVSGAEVPSSPGPASGFKPGTTPKPKGPPPSGRSGWIIYRERITKMGKKALEGFFKDTPLVADFVEQMESRGLNEMLRRGGEVEAVDIHPVLEKVIQDASGRRGSLDNILGTQIAQQIRTEEDIKKKVKEMDEAAARVRDLHTKIEETDKKYLPVLDKYAEFLAHPLANIKRQLGERLPSKAPETAPGEAPRAEPRPIEVSQGNYQQTLKNMLSKYRRGITEKTAAVSVLPTDEYRRQHGVTQQLQDMKKGIEAEKDPVKRARQVQQYLRLSLDSLRRAQDYLHESRPSIEADRATIDNLEAYVASEGARKDPGIAEVRAQLKTLKDNFEHESRIFGFMTDAVRRVEEGAPRAQEYLKKVTEDLGDNKVEQLYSVAVAPEMEPSKEEAREIHERTKKHEEAIGFIIDRDTYKKNMNRIMTRKLEQGAPMKELRSKYRGEGKTTGLPSERVEEYKKGIEELMKRREEIEKITVEHDRLYKEQQLYKALIGIHDKMKTESATMDEKVRDLQDIQKNLQYLSAGKDDLSEETVAKDRALLVKALTKYDVKEESLGRVIQEEERAAEDYRRRLVEFDKEAAGYHEKLKEIEEQLSKVKATPVMTPQRLRERLMELRVERQAIMTRADLNLDQRNKRRGELDKEIEALQDQIEGPGHREAAIEDVPEPETEFERAEKEKSFRMRPAPYMEALPKPKGWDTVEKFFDDAKKELVYLENLKIKGKDWDDKAIKEMSDRMDELEHIIPAIEAYKNQIVQIGPEAVPLRETVTRFEDMMLQYEGVLRKYLNQREDAQNRWARLQQEVDILQSMFDRETGEFKGFKSEEIVNIKNIFFRMLYKYLDTYWSTRVGKNINVFGERDTNWYDNVYRTFRNLSQVRSNKKLMSLLNSYKEATQSEFPKDASRRPSRIQALEDRMADIYRGYKDQGIDPETSAEYKDLKTRLDNLKAQKSQIKKVFDNMAGAVEAVIHDKVEEAISGQITDQKPKAETDLEKKVDESVEQTMKILEADMPEIASSETVLRQTEQLLSGAEKSLGIEAPAEGSSTKTAYDRSHPDFDLKILYGPVMQRTIVSMLNRRLV